jgi:voltage-gated potassium channel Kch
MVDRISREPLVGAWRAVAVVTLSVTVIGGVLMRITDPDTFGNVWLGLWWAAQTITTVGYGDIIPESVAGRIIAVVIMLGGVAFITVTSAAIASAFVEAARRRSAASSGNVGMEGEIRLLRGEIEALRAEVRDLREDGKGA